MRLWVQTLAAFAFASLALAMPAAAAEPIDGTWRTENKDALVRIGECGGKVCGRIVRFLVPPPGGTEQRDVNNPDSQQRTRKLLGLAILSGFAPKGEAWNGTIYDPKTGKSYRSVLRRTARDRLEVKGCVGPFCRTQIWRKAD